MLGSTDFQSSFRIPQNRDSILQLLEGNLNGPLDKAALIDFYRLLRERESKIVSSDREFYLKLHARFEGKLTAQKIEVPGLFKIERPAPEDAIQAPKKPVETISKKVVAPAPEPAVQRSVTVKAPEVPLKYTIQFAEHLTYPDNTVVYFGQKFVKQWKVVNPSDESVPVACKVKSFASNNLVAPRLDTILLLAEIKPKEFATISVEMQAPNAPGTYIDYFRFTSPTGKELGDTLTCRVVVKLKSNCPVCNKPDCPQNK